MRYLLLLCLLPVLSLCAEEVVVDPPKPVEIPFVPPKPLTQEQLDEQEFQAYQEAQRAAQLAAMEAKQRAEEVAQVEKDVATLKADYPALTPDAALLKLREDFKKAKTPEEKWAKYGKLREIEPRIKALQARNANGTQVPSITAVLTTEKAKVAEPIEVKK
jgi:hypothetical protein